MYITCRTQRDCRSYRKRRFTHATVATSPTTRPEHMGIVADITLPDRRRTTIEQNPRFIPAFRDPGTCHVWAEQFGEAWQYALAGIPVTLRLYTTWAMRITAQAFLIGQAEGCGFARFVFDGEPSVAINRRRSRYKR